MRLTSPRLPPLPTSEWTDEIREILTGTTGSPAGGALNIFSTLARHPTLLKRWLVFASHVLRKSTLPERERELCILRVGWLCRSGYEWGQHVVIARRAGITDDEIRRVADGSDAPDWATADRALLTATDELHADSFITDGTWQALAERWNEQQRLDLIFTVGQYHLVSMALNTLGVQLDPGTPTFEESAGRRP
jgi:alkylhydroperoxidase family enzyme